MFWINNNHRFVLCGIFVPQNVSYLDKGLLEKSGDLRRGPSGTSYDIPLLQNGQEHGPEGIVKTIEKPILQRTQVHLIL